ncbi:hypothetical protein ABQ012_21335, partial [Xanthomonas hortorum pv. hederae]
SSSCPSSWVHGLYSFSWYGSVGAGHFGVPPLSIAISSSPGEAPVWPSAQGTAKGPSLSPLSAGVPNAVLADPALHQLLALQDALRSGRARERTLAARYLKQLLRLGDAL